MRQRERMRPGKSDDTKARPAQRRINAEENDMSVCDAHGGFQRDGGSPRGAGDARFHLVELLERDAHAAIVSGVEVFQKQKRPRVAGVNVLFAVGNRESIVPTSASAVASKLRTVGRRICRSSGARVARLHAR